MIRTIGDEGMLRGVVSRAGVLFGSLRHGRLLWLHSGVLIASICAVFLFDLHNRKLAAIEETKVNALSFANVLAEHTARTFEAIERTLKATDAVRLSFKAGAINIQAADRALQALHSNAPALLAVGWTNAAGDVIAHSYGAGPVRSNVSDLPHFMELRVSHQAELFISPAYRSKASGGWISAAALRFDDAEGAFAGIIAAPLDLSYFARTFASVKLGDHDAVSLFRRDGTMLIREPYVERALSFSYAKMPLFAERLKSAPFGTFEAVSPVDHAARIYGFREVAGLPLVVVVTRDRIDALAAWSHHLHTVGPLVAAFAFVILIGTFQLVRKTAVNVRQNALLEATLENMHEGLIVVDDRYRIAICNRRASELLDLPQDFMRSEPRAEDVIAYQAASGEFDEIPDDVWRRVLPKRSGETENIYERKRRDGRLIEVRTVPFQDGGVVRTYADVTDQRQMQQELFRREAQFRTLAESVTDVLARMNFDGVLNYVSPSCGHVLGHGFDRLVGTNIKDYIHPDDLASVVAAFAMLTRPGGNDPHKLEYRFRHANGQWRWLESNPTLIHDASGEPRELVDIVRDITERKRVEEEAAAARKMAEQAALAKSQFLSAMSHELRTPLNSIVGFSSLILDRADVAPDIRRQVSLISTASDSLLAIVNDILDFSKAEEGRLELTSAPFALADLVESSVCLVRGVAVTKGLELRVNIAPELPDWIVGDEQRLRQVLVNFLNNAVKFTHQGHVALDVAGTPVTSDGKTTLRFAVLDTGIGIPEEKYDRLFQHFSQVDGSISREYGGSGLGLAICKKLVRLMGGEIGFESRAGLGSTFWFTVDLAMAVAPVRQEVTGRAPERLSQARILLVEDFDLNREIACTILEKKGYSVVAASNGSDAIRLVQSDRFDVVLMDVQMPVVDGVAATQAIRALGAPYDRLPIVAMTANVMPDQIRRFLESGMDGHLGKPFRPAQLLSTVATYLARTRVADMQDYLDGPQEAASQLSTIMTPIEVEKMQDMLAERLRGFLDLQDTLDALPEISRQAHRLAAAAGFLGYAEVSRHCRDLEVCLARGEDGSVAFRSAIEATRTALGRMNRRAVA